MWLVAGVLWFAWANLGDRKTIEFETAPPLSYEFQVDVNEADWPELAQLPGVGETLAKRIVESRDREGRYQHLEDLTRVKGIGPRTLERIRPYLRPLPPISATVKNTPHDAPPTTP
ncbi:MAG: helix-hairpin-helix domain-containing protein [Planctomycetota bacterium]|nr:MAG: helix-hairpin-helix domain-containing protein [Planctomycetota bacterium]